jgi:hypothetical protein
LALSDGELVERFMTFNKDWGNQPTKCVRKTSGDRRPLKCFCLAIVNTAGDLAGETPSDLCQKAAAHFQLHFGKLAEIERQLKVMEWIRHGGTTINQPFLLPFLTPPNATIPSLVELDGHRMCKRALLSVLGVGCNWFNTCHAFMKEGAMPAHGLAGKQTNRKRKFAAEEEADLQAFMDNLKAFTEPSATRFVREVTGQIEMRDTDDEALCLGSSWTKRDCYKWHCLGRGYNVEMISIGAMKLITIDLELEEDKKSCTCWSTSHDCCWKLRVHRNPGPGLSNPF